MPAGKLPKKAASESQRNLAGMAQAYKDGTLNTKKMSKAFLAKIKKFAEQMPSQDLKSMAHTKEAGLPRRVGENIFIKDFKTFLNEESTI